MDNDLKIEEEEENKPRLEKIIMKYSDGTEKETTKGLVAMVSGSRVESHLDLELANMNGDDVYKVVQGFVQLAQRIGVLRYADEGEDDEE